MKQALNALAFLLSAGAVVLMVLPTYVTTFGADGGERGFLHHRWFDPFLLVYLDVVPALALISGIVLTAGLLVGLVRARVPGWVSIPGIGAALLLVIFSYDTNSAGFVGGAGQLVAPILATSSVLSTIAWWPRRRR